MLSLFSRRIRASTTTTTTSSILLSSSSSSLYSAPSSCASVRFCSSTGSSGAASVAQQSEQEEYEEILRNAKKQNQLQQDQPTMDSSATARLLRVAAPALFDELKFVSEFKASTTDTKSSSKTVSSKNNKNDSSKNPLEGQVILAKKYLQVDSPEVFTWVCSTCQDEFQAPVLERALNDVGCPTCSKKNAPKTLSDFRDLMVEISPMANDPFLDPESVPADSRKKVEWKCRVCGYNWVARVSDRCAVSSFVASGSIRTTYASASGGACPRCHIRQSVGAAEKLKNEWHPVKNGDLDPAATLVLSEKKKSVWWLCSNCTHEWNAKVSSRFAGQGCPACGSGSTAAKSGRPKGSGNKKDMLIGGGYSSSENNPFVEDDRKKEHHREQVRLRKILLQQQENADRENQYKMHLKHLEEHGKLKEMFSSTAAAAGTPAAATTQTSSVAQNENDNNDDEQISLGGGAETKSVTKKSATTTTTTTTTRKAPSAGGVMITKAKTNPLREATVVQLHFAEKKKQVEYQRQKELELMRKMEAKHRDEEQNQSKSSAKKKKVNRPTTNLKKQFSSAKKTVDRQKKKSNKKNSKE